MVSIRCTADSIMIYGRSHTASYRGGLTGEANGHHWGGIHDDWGGNCLPSKHVKIRPGIFPIRRILDHLGGNLDYFTGVSLATMMPDNIGYDARYRTTESTWPKGLRMHVAFHQL